MKSPPESCLSPSTSLFKIKHFCPRPIGKMETVDDGIPRLPPARLSPDRRSADRRCQAHQGSLGRVHDATEIGIPLIPTHFPASAFSTINNITVTDHNDNASEYAFNYGSSHPATLNVRRYHDVEVKEVCNRQRGMYRENKLRKNAHDARLSREENAAKKEPTKNNRSHYPLTPRSHPSPHPVHPKDGHAPQR